MCTGFASPDKKWGGGLGKSIKLLSLKHLSFQNHSVAIGRMVEAQNRD